MGYTHYWTHKTAFTDSEWETIKTDVLAILQTARDTGIEFGDGWGEKPLETKESAFDGETLIFNGLGSDSHETFAIEQNKPEWAFCKTAYKPYDVAVTAILAYLEGAHPDKFSASSDGEPDDWKAGIDLVKKALGTRGAFAQIPAEILEDAA